MIGIFFMYNLCELEFEFEYHLSTGMPTHEGHVGHQ